MSRQNLIPVPVLSLVHLVYKVEARHNRLPGHRRQLLGAPFAARRGRGLVGAELGHVSLGEVSRLAPGIVPASPGTWRTGTPARLSTCALSPCWCAPGGCWCAASSSGPAESRACQSDARLPPLWPAAASLCAVLT